MKHKSWDDLMIVGHDPPLLEAVLTQKQTHTGESVRQNSTPMFPSPQGVG